MPKMTVTVGIVAASHPPASRWAQRVVRPVAVLDAPAAAPPGARLGPEGPVETWYLGPAAITLHHGDTGHYRDNLTAARPSVWVALAPGAPLPRVALVTVDPYEGETLAGDEGLVVEALAIPPALAAAVAAFFEAHHVEHRFEKRRRDRANPDALGRRGPLAGGPGR